MFHFHAFPYLNHLQGSLTRPSAPQTHPGQGPTHRTTTQRKCWGGRAVEEAHHLDILVLIPELLDVHTVGILLRETCYLRS